MYKIEYIIIYHTEKNGKEKKSQISPKIENQLIHYLEKLVKNIDLFLIMISTEKRGIAKALIQTIKHTLNMTFIWFNFL